MNGLIVVKVGSGYMQIDEYIWNFGAQEEQRIKWK